MSYLGAGKKEDLIILAGELGLEVLAHHKIIDLKKLIVGSESYDEDFVKELFKSIVEERKNEERKKEVAEMEKFKLEHELEVKERERQHDLELRKLEISGKNIQRQEASESNNKIQLLSITPKFDEKKDEMSLYLINFERRAQIANIPRQDWVAYLLNVVPSEITNMLARESPENANDYDFVKELILRRYKLNAEKLKQNFYRHMKTSETSWRNFAQELNSYFCEWISELGVTTFGELKELMVTEQMKRRVPYEMKEHFLDDWIKIKSYSDLAEKLDDYESLRDSFKVKNPNYHKVQRKDFLRNSTKNDCKDNEKFGKGWQRNSHFKERLQEKEFEKRKQLQCYECGSYNHLRPQCPKIKRNPEIVASHHTTKKGFHDRLEPYISIGEVNSIEMPILRDTGATIDLICNKYVQPHMFTGECVWIKSPFEEASSCYPLAEIEVNCKFGHVITKAAVVRLS